MRCFAVARLESVVALIMLVLPASVRAQSIGYSVLVDTDTDEATGCAVALPDSGSTIQGIERRLTATVDPTTLRITGVALEVCTGTSFDPPAELPGTPYPVALNAGVNGGDVIELAVDSAAIAPPGTMVRLYATAQTDSTDDLLTTVDGTATGAPILVTLEEAEPEATPIPTLSRGGLLMLILLLTGLACWWLRRSGARRVTTVLLLSLTGLVLAATPDGDLSEWIGTNPVGTARQGDSASPETDLVALFADVVNGILCLRIDAANLESLSPTAEPDNYATPANTSISRTAADSDDLLDNDDLGQPTATLIQFGAGSLGGGIADNAAGTTITPLPTFADGSLTVNADGSFGFTPPSGFRGGFGFDYRLSNGAGAADATVTIAVGNQTPIVKDQTFRVDENSPDGTFVGTVVATKPDANDTLRFAITRGTGNTAFAIDGNSGELAVADTTQLDFETTPSFTVIVVVTSSTGLADSATVTVILNDINEAPIADDQAVTTVENTALAITLTGSDVDNDSLTFTIVAGPANGSLGTVTALTTTSAEVTYTPNGGFNGVDRFTFIANDGTVDSAPAAVDITVD